jgi:hypothetical protein
MDPVSESLRLLKRQAHIEHQRRQPGGISIVDERELFAIRAQLNEFPAAVSAIAQLVAARGKPVDQLCVEDIEQWDGRQAS